MVQEAGCDPGSVWTGKENLASKGIRSPDCPVHNGSLYSVRFPAHGGGGIHNNLWIINDYCSKAYI
jgi:hypothetical protein